MSEASEAKKRPPRRRRRNNRSKKTNPESANRPKLEAKANSPKKSRNNNRRRSNRPKLSAADRYDLVLEQYLAARKKFYEMHARTKGQQLKKIENNYQKTLKELFNYRESLNDEGKEKLDKKLNLYPEDNQFTTTHGLPLEGEVEQLAEPIDIHYLETQKQSFADDTEVSEGSFEDYLAYKETSR